MPDEFDIEAPSASVGKSPASGQSNNNTGPVPESSQSPAPSGTGPAHNDGTPFPDRPNVPTSDPGTSRTDDNSGSDTGQLDQALVEDAKKLGFNPDQFKSNDEINQALLDYDRQLLTQQFQPPQYAQPPMMNPAQQQWAMPGQMPQQQPMQQPGMQQPGQVQGQPENQNPAINLDPDQLDEPTYQALSSMQQQMQTIQQQNQMLQQQYEQAQVEAYVSKMMPIVSAKNDPRLDQSNPYGQQTVFSLLEQAETIRQARAMRGVQVTDQEAFDAAYRMYQNSVGSANNSNGVSDQMIGVPGNQRHAPPPPGDERALNTIRQYVPDSPQVDMSDAFPDIDED